jgi:hypothetical protein
VPRSSTPGAGDAYFGPWGKLGIRFFLVSAPLVATVRLGSTATATPLCPKTGLTNLNIYSHQSPVLFSLAAQRYGPQGSMLLKRAATCRLLKQRQTLLKILSLRHFSYFLYGVRLARAFRHTNSSSVGLR